MDLTSKLTFEQIFSMTEFADIVDVLISNCYIPDLGISLEQMEAENPDWNAESIVYGLKRLAQLRENGKNVIWDFWTEEEKEKSPDKRDAKLLFMQGEPGMPFVVICPGGGYNAVCVMKEGLPIGARLNELGYHAFILNYRVRQLGVAPKAMEDLRKAICFILNNAEQFEINTENYAMMGFSSGGHLAGEWGTDNYGAASQGMKMPAAVILGYPASDVKVLEGNEMGTFLIQAMVGENITEDKKKEYNVNAHIGENYPPTYLWHCKDDPIIPYQTAVIMKERMEEMRQPCMLRLVEHGGHGCGLGIHTEAEGWFEEAVGFWGKYMEPEETGSRC